MWNSRLPVSRVKPFSAANDPSPGVTRQRSARSAAAAAASTSGSSVVHERAAGSRSSRRGAGGVGARIERQCAATRGSTQPIRETNSSR